VIKINIFELFGKVALDGSAKVKGELTGLEKQTEKVQKGMRVMGAAFTAVGVAGLAIISSTKKINAQLGVTAINLGVTTKEMRDLTLAVSNVTFAISEVTATFDLLARAGVKDTEVLKATATAFDTLGDATGNTASITAGIMIDAMKTFGLTAEEIASKGDMMTYMARNSTIGLEDFATMVGYTDQEMVAAGLTIEDMAAMMMYMSDSGVAPGKVMLREWQAAVTRSKKENISMTEALGMTNEELVKYNGGLQDSEGVMQQFADAANEQYTIMDKVKQKFSELTLGASGFLEPLEPILAGMTALGPLMIVLSTSAGTAAVKWGLHTIALVAHKVALFASAIAIKAVTAAQWLWNAAMSANPIGLIILGITALIAAGIALWKNWDKVTDFFEGFWINLKIAFAEGVKFIVNTVLLPFLEFYGKMFGSITMGIGKLVGLFNKELGASIEAVGNKLMNARAEITAWADDLAEGARVEKGIRDTEKAIDDVGVALDDTTEIINENTEATGDLTDALVLNQEALALQKEQLEDQLKAYEDLLEKAQEAVKQYEYERSAAGELGITTGDVTTALIDQGWTADRIADLWAQLGDDVNYADRYLAAAGLTSSEIDAILKKLGGTVSGVADNYDELTESVQGFSAAVEAVYALEMEQYAGMTYEEKLKKYQEEGGYAPWLSEATIKADIARAEASNNAYLANLAGGGGGGGSGSGGSALSGSTGGYYSGPSYGYAKGGIIPGRLGEAVPILAHAGEEVLPADKVGRSINIYVEMDGRVIAKAIGQPLVDEIRVRTGLKG